MKTLGNIKPNAAGQILGTGFDEFVSPLGCDGLCRITGSRLDLLFIGSKEQGRGHLRNFINGAKEEFSHIRIIEIWNPILETILLRYGFKPFQDVESINGETEFISGMEWIK